MYYVYLLESKESQTWYIGYSANLKRRLNEHQTHKGGRTTSQKGDWRLIYYEAYRNQQDAIGREKFLKSGSGRKFLQKQLKHHLQNRPKNG